MRKSMVLALAAVAGLPAVALADVRVGGWAQSQGTSSAGSRLSDGTSVAAWSNLSDVILNKQNPEGRLFKKLASLASVNLEAHSNGVGNRARVTVGGRTVYSKDVGNRGGSFKYGPWTQDVISGSVEVFDYGVFGVRASGSAGAGVQFSGTWTLQSSPPRADLIAAAQTWGYATGKIEARLLWGAGSLSTSATVNFFNATLRLQGYGTKSGIAVSHAWHDMILWELWIKFKLKVLGFKVWDKTVIHETGPSTTRQMF